MTATDVTTTQIRLRWYHSDRLTAEWCYARPFRIGRDDGCEVRIDHSLVDSQHAEIFPNGSGWRVRDLGTKRNTFVNGAQVDDVRLGSPSMLQLGWNGPLLQLTIEPVNGASTNGLVSAVEPPPVEQHRYTSYNGHKDVAPAAPKPVPEPALSIPADAPRYRGHGFTLPLPDGWMDRTLYTIAGPVADGVRHTIVVEVDPAPGFDTAAAYTDNQARLLAKELDGFRLFKHDQKTLADGTPVQRLIFRWKLYGQPPIYQEQILLLHNGAMYKQTASFTNTSRKKLGAEVEALMLHFKPG